MERSKVLLILNPVAGHRAARKALYPIVQMLCAKESMVTVYSTRAQGEARRIAREEGPRYDRVICCGGDGTLSEVLSGLVLSGARVPVGYVPPAPPMIWRMRWACPPSFHVPSILR